MKYIIIGLGIYGENLARDLVEMGHEVIGADNNGSVVDAMKNYISTVYLVDSTEEGQLAVLPLDNVDLVIVAIGENFGASIKTVALLKKLGVKHIYARAIDTLHEAILQSFELDRILTPEQRAAGDLSLEMQLGTSVETLAVGRDDVIVNLRLPNYMIGLTYNNIIRRFSDEYGLSLVAASRHQITKNLLGVSQPALLRIEDNDTEAENGDILTIFGTRKAIKQFCRKNG